MQFTYRAKQDSQTESSGVIEAVDFSAAIIHLKRMGLYPLEVVPLENEKNSSKIVLPHTVLSRVSLALWARTLGQGLAAGLTLTQALSLLAEQEKGRPIGQVAKFLEEQVTGGESLANSMQHVGTTFSPIVVNLIRAGEASGALEEVLQALALQMESEAELMGKVWGALVYPFFVLTVGIGTVIVLLCVVMPKLSLLFAETGQPLPWATKLLMESGQFLAWGFGVFVGGCAVGFWMFQAWRGRLVQWIAEELSHLPLFGRLIIQAEIARLSATLSLLLQQGLPLPEALRLGAGTVNLPTLRTQLQRCEQEVVEGMNFSVSLRRVGINQPFLLTMVAMGEAQGDLARAFAQAGARYRQEVDRDIKIISTLIEPIMILLVGLLVGGIVFSMLLPIFQINFAVG